MLAPARLSVPGISNVRIVADKGPVEGASDARCASDGADAAAEQAARAGVERLMFQALRGADIHERVTWEHTAERGLVRFAMLSDACLEGVVLNEAVALDAGRTRVTYSMDWRYRADVAPEARKAPFPDGGVGAITGAVRAMKAAAEAAALAAPPA